MPSSLCSRRAHSKASSSVIVNDLVDDVRVQVLGDEAGADPLDLVTAGLERLALHLLRDDRRGDRLDRDRLEARLARLDDLGHAGDRAAGADAGDEDVDLAVGVLPDFLGGGRAVDLRVGGIFELLRHEALLVLARRISSALAIAPLMPSAAGVSTTCAPSAFSSRRRSMLMSRASSGSACSPWPRRRTPARCRCCRWSARR